MTDKIGVNGGKYTIQLEKDGNLDLYRHGELWAHNPLYSNMLISVMYELKATRKLLADISGDFDPDERLGPPCGPEILDRIKQYEEQFGVDLDHDLDHQGD